MGNHGEAGPAATAGRRLAMKGVGEAGGGTRGVWGRPPRPAQRYAGEVLRTRAWRSSSLRLLNDRDLDDVLGICDRDAVTNVFVGSRVHAAGVDPGRLGAQMWGYLESGRMTSLCYSGANLVPVAATSGAVAAFAERARLQGRRCSSIV